MDTIRPNFKDINISFYQAFLGLIVVELSFSLWLISNKIMIKDLEDSK